MADFGIGEIALGASLLSGVVGAGGAIYGGMAQKSMYDYQANVAQMNAKIAQQNAAYEVAQGETQAQIQGMKTRATVGAIRAQQGASGLDINTGSSVEVRAGESEIGAFDQAVIRSNAQRRAYGFEVEAAGDVAQAALDREAGNTAELAGDIGGVSSLLGGIGSFGSKWLQGKSIGLWGS